MAKRSNSNLIVFKRDSLGKVTFATMLQRSVMILQIRNKCLILEQNSCE